MLHESISHCASEARFETWESQHTVSSQTGEQLFFYFQTAFPLQHEDSAAEEYPCKVIKAMYYFWRLDEGKKCEHPLWLELHAAAQGSFLAPASSPIQWQCLPQPGLTHYFTLSVNVVTRSVISSRSSELCLASARQKAMWLSLIKRHSNTEGWSPALVVSTILVTCSSYLAGSTLGFASMQPFTVLQLGSPVHLMGFSWNGRL